jgi:membrane protease YdiL (CAAX protease family)
MNMKKRNQRTSLFIVLLLLGLTVFVVFSHMRPVFTGITGLAGRISLIAVLLFASYLAKNSDKFKKYREMLFAFFIAALATSVDYYIPSSQWLLSILQIPIQSPAGIAVDKLDSSIIIIGIILLFTKISGSSFASIYLNKHNLRRSLTIGIIAFLIAASGAVAVAGLFGAKDLTAARILPWTPWILIFIAGNALNEELLFRGLFLRKIEPFTGGFCSNLVLAIPFVLHHTGVAYTNDALLFLLYLLPLALIWGYIMQKTDSIWGSVLFHAGTDITVVLTLFSQLPD